MKYDANTPVAVFLGPSLDRATAETLLKANYYPPVQRGDIYRLLGTGVRLIVIIDGVFHATAPVWQREIVAALDKGIAVVGASSMGALRAAELHPFGMVGVGRIFEWYRDGVLDGDDEVALMHSDGEFGYLPLSTPLVNIRETLARARDRGILDAARHDEFVAFSKNAFFGVRSYEHLLTSPAVVKLASARREELSRFFEDAVDLKRADAMAAIEVARRHVATGESAQTRRAPLPQASSAFGALERLWRGVLRDDGELVLLSSLLPLIAADSEAFSGRLREVVLRHFVLEWAVRHGWRAPAGAVDHYRSQLALGEDKLRSVGLTREEFDEASERRATAEWILARSPETFGLDFGAQRRCARALASWPATRSAGSDQAALEASFVRQATESRCLAAWATDAGVDCPEQVELDFVANWLRANDLDSAAPFLEATGLAETDFHTVWRERARHHWLLERGPRHFGHREFSAEVAVLEDLQVSGELAAFHSKVAP